MGLKSKVLTPGAEEELNKTKISCQKDNDDVG